jgi:hypothetical protein
VILEKLNLEGTPESNGKFDLIILKMTDELVRTDDPKVLAIVNNAKVRSTMANFYRHMSSACAAGNVVLMMSFLLPLSRKSLN